MNDIIKLEGSDLDKTLIDEISLKNILIYGISYKTLVSLETLRIRFDKIDEIKRIYNGTRFLALFRTNKYDVIYEKIRYLISIKSSTHIFFGKSKLILMILYL